MKIRNAGNTAWITRGQLDTPNFGRATLGANTFTGAQNYNGVTLSRAVLRDYSEKVNVLGDVSGIVAISTATGNVVTATVAGPTTFSFGTTWPAGIASSLTLKLTNGGAYDVTWPTGCKWPGGEKPALAPTGVDLVTLMTLDGGVTWLGCQATPPAEAPFPKLLDVTETSFAADSDEHAVAMPAAVTAGQLLLVPLTLEGTQPFGGHVPTITTPVGWTRLWSAALGNGTTARFAGYAKVADGTEAGGTVNFVTDDDANGAAQVHRVDKWSGDLAGVEVSAVVTGGSAAPNSPSLAASWGKGRTLWFSFIGTADDDAAVTAYPADYEGGMNTLSGASLNDGGAVASARRAREVATENPGAATLNSVDAWGAVTVAVRSK